MSSTLQSQDLTASHAEASAFRDRYRSRSRLGIGAALLGVSLGLAGCSGGQAGGAESFTIAFIEPDLTTLPLMAAVDTLRDDGYDVETVELADPELAIEGLASGDYAISAEATSPALVAAERGAPIRIIADVVGNQWGVYTVDGIESCEDLAGRAVGIYSEGAVATAMLRAWVADNCPEGMTEPEYLVIGGSDVRAQALLAEEVDATALALADVITLETTTGTAPNQLVDFREQLPTLNPQTVYANAEFLENSPEEAQAFVTSLIEQHEMINDDPSHLVELAGTYLNQEPSEVLEATAQAFVDQGLFDAGGLTQESMQGTIDFFTDAGVVSDVTFDDAVDLSLLD